MVFVEIERSAKLRDGDEDSERIAHLISDRDWARAYVEGKPVRALCGKRWVPTRDPDHLPLCESCNAVFRKKFGENYGT